MMTIKKSLKSCLKNFSCHHKVSRFWTFTLFDQILRKMKMWYRFKHMIFQIKFWSRPHGISTQIMKCRCTKLSVFTNTQKHCSCKEFVSSLTTPMRNSKMLKRTMMVKKQIKKRRNTSNKVTVDTFFKKI